MKKNLLGDLKSIPDPGPARRLGTRTLKLGVDLLGLARIHDNALAALEKTGLSTEGNAEMTRRSTAFFNSVLKPIEESRFTSSEANLRLEASIKTLTRRTKALDRSNEKFRLEILRREDVERSLRTSEATTSLLLKQAHEMQEQLRLLSRRLISVQECERRRISRELHDVIAQTLAGINLRLAIMRSQSISNAEDFHEKIEITERLVEQSVETVHRFASDLRPAVLDDLGLIPALRSYIDSFTERYNIPVKLVASPEIEELESSGLTALFRIAQEALTNTARHAKPNLVNVRLRPTEKSFRMTISDNGKGFTIGGAAPVYDSKRLGILGMRERAEMVGGSFEIESVVGKGTVIRVEIPRTATAPPKHSRTKPKARRTVKKSK